MQGTYMFLCVCPCEHARQAETWKASNNSPWEFPKGLLPIQGIIVKEK